MSHYLVAILPKISAIRGQTAAREVGDRARQAGLFETAQHLPLGFRTPVNINGGTDLRPRAKGR